MAKPKRVRSTEHPIGRKINLVLEEKGLPGDYTALAKEFDVALTSVYGWVEKGRISKDRLPKLAEWSGRPLDWWLAADDHDESIEDGPALIKTLQSWRMQASHRSQKVIDQLCVLAQKNALRDEDWILIEQMVKRLRSQ